MAIKILTNIRFAQTAGIAQTLSAFLNFIRQNKKNCVQVVGVNVVSRSKNFYRKNKKANISIISSSTNIPNVKNVVETSKNIKDIEEKYSKVINIYRKAIKNEKPDLVLVLVNGTYYMPWCLFIAAQRESLPIVLHYHGVLAKEVQNWPKKQKNLFLKMERSFDKKNLFYIFPSELTKNTVEKEIFGHKIKSCAVIPNPVPLHFFKGKKKQNKVNIGIVSRFAGVKNMGFCQALAEYNSKVGGDFVVNLITDLKKTDHRYKQLSKIIKIHSSVENENLPEFYGNMGVVISPSHFETYGNVSKEALACGTPAIVNYNMGVSETFEKLGLGDWIMDFDSVKKVYGQIKNVIGCRVEGQVRKNMKKMYSPEKIFSQIMGVLESAAQ